MKLSNLLSLLTTFSLAVVTIYLGQSVQARTLNVNLSAQDNQQIQSNIVNLKTFQRASQSFYQDLAKLDPSLPGLSTAGVEFYRGLISVSILAGDYGSAYQTLPLVDEALQAVLANQTQIVQWEIDRLDSVVAESLVTADNLFLGAEPWRARYDSLSKSRALQSEQRLGELRALQGELAQAIFLRRLQSEQAVKSMVIKKSELKMYLYEDNQLIFELPLSLGRPGYGTRSGQFRVLDKLDTVWGYWQIYLPYWMGIYFAGGTENGIHGLPWDKAGNIYWEKDVGRSNVTYGCVMGLDEDIGKVYDWAEVGTPVTIVN